MRESFFIVAHEQGQTGQRLPTWSDRDVPIDFAPDPSPVTRVDIAQVPGAFQLLGLLTPGEVQQFIEVAEQLGFHADAPLDQPAYLRRNENLNWVVSDAIVDRLWQRACPCIHDAPHGEVARGLNARFRFYRYAQGDYFRRHEDVGWVGSRVVDGRLVEAFDPSLRSLYTFLILLNDDFEGGATQFEVSGRDLEFVDVRTPLGAALCFPHGRHPARAVHCSTPITGGTKYIIRTDVLFPDAAGREHGGSTSP